MRHKISAFGILFSVVIIACHKENNYPGFSYRNAAGKWIPYEIVNQMGNTETGPFTASSIFSVYAESVNLNEDRTYSPGIFYDDSLFLKPESGVYRYNPLNNDLIFEGTWSSPMKTKLLLFKNDEMWLEFSGETIKFKRP